MIPARRHGDQNPADENPADENPAERGYVMPMLGLLLVPLMIFAALATDVGAWYVRADQAQRAADAAALAGTVWLPDEAAATSVALDVAARNGFRDPAWVAANGGEANASISVPGITEQGGLRVDIATSSPSFFGSLVLDTVSIERRAVAAVTTPVRLGNPSNGLGTGNLDISELGIPPDGVWLSLNGWCQDHQNGDPISVGKFGAWLAGGNIYNTCASPTLGDNPTLDPDGYTFIIDVPPGAGDVAIEVFEPGLCTDANGADLFYSAGEGNNGGPRLNFRVFANDDTLLHHDDNLATTPVASHLYALTDCTGGGGPGGRWYVLYTIPDSPASAGRWYVQANSRMNVNEYNMNLFALRARPTADIGLCTSMTDATCPQLYARNWLPIWRPPFGGAAFAGQPAEFFLAEISDEHAGKTAVVSMFDAGEGMNNIQLLDPAGNPVAFEKHLANCEVGMMCSNPAQWPDTSPGPNDSCSGVPCLLVTGSRFQDQWVVMNIHLPPAYSCGGNCWWKVRYTPSAGSTVNDRTTWSVRVVGGPVRLIE